MTRQEKPDSQRHAARPKMSPEPETLATLRPKGMADRLRTLQPQEVVIGLFGEYAKGGEEVWSGGLVALLNDLHFSPAAARIALNRLVARELLKPIRSGKFVHYKATPKLAVVLEEGRRLTFSSTEREWDGTWTLVWYSIPESLRRRRAKLSRWLSFRGFGALQDGTWIAPGSRVAEVATLVEQLGLRQFTLVFTAEADPQLAPRTVVDHVWKLDGLAEAYAFLAAEFRPFSGRRNLEAMSPPDAFVVRTRAIEMFRQTVSQDPHLPDDVLKINWTRKEAVRAFETLQRGLAKPAEQFFRLQTSPPNGNGAP